MGGQFYQKRRVRTFEDARKVLVFSAEKNLQAARKGLIYDSKGTKFLLAMVCFLTVLLFGILHILKPEISLLVEIKIFLPILLLATGALIWTHNRRLRKLKKTVTLMNTVLEGDFSDKREEEWIQLANEYLETIGRSEELSRALKKERVLS